MSFKIGLMSPYFTAIRSVFSQIDSVAGTDSAVLILGETAVGKGSRGTIHS
ncbi:hypothetical protein KKA14_15660 [bacterium]|nr:hypothetical protein [bacterium]